MTPTPYFPPACSDQDALLADGEGNADAPASHTCLPESELAPEPVGTQVQR
jgi:hypothetical protein